MTRRRGRLAIAGLAGAAAVLLAAAPASALAAPVGAVTGVPAFSTVATAADTGCTDAATFIPQRPPALNQLPVSYTHLTLPPIA